MTGLMMKSASFINSLKDTKIVIIQHKFNRGLAESVRDIFEYVSENSDDNDLLIRNGRRCNT